MSDDELQLLHTTALTVRALLTFHCTEEEISPPEARMLRRQLDVALRPFQTGGESLGHAPDGPKVRGSLG
jgi:hypothetical protein